MKSSPNLPRFYFYADSVGSVKFFEEFEKRAAVLVKSGNKLR